MLQRVWSQEPRNTSVVLHDCCRTLETWAHQWCHRSRNRVIQIDIHLLIGYYLPYTAFSRTVQKQCCYVKVQPHNNQIVCKSTMFNEIKSDCCKPEVVWFNVEDAVAHYRSWSYMRMALRISLFWIWDDDNIRRNSNVITTSGYCSPSSILGTRSYTNMTVLQPAINKATIELRSAVQRIDGD